MARGDKKTNDALISGTEAIKRQKEGLQELNKMFSNLGDNISRQISNVLGISQELGDATERVSDIYKNDIARHISNAASSLNKQSDIQKKILAGENASKDINDALAKNKARTRALIDKIRIMKKNGLAIDHEQIKAARIAHKVEKETLEEQLKQNVERKREDGIIKGIGKALLDNVDKLDKSGNLSKILSGNLSDMTMGDVGAAGQGMFIKFLLDGIALTSKLESELNKTLGLSLKQASALRQQFAQVAFATNNVSINSRDIQSTFMSLNEQFGTASTVLRNDIVAEMAILGKLTGMSAESQMRFASTMMRTGKSAEVVTAESRKAIVNAEKEHGVRLDINKVMDEAGKISGMIAANLGYNITAIAGAVAKAKQFGMTLQGLADISNNMLDFQSSIEAELQAELFIGRDLNLERARLYALTGDYANLAEEIKHNAGGELAFARMNVLEKQKLAAALGMSADQMSDMLFNQANLAELAQEARANGEDDLADMLEKRDMQQQFNDLVEKVQMTFVDIANGPLGVMANLLVSILDSSLGFFAVMTLIGGIKIAGLITSMASLWTTLTGASISAVTLASALTLGIAAIAITAGIIAITASSKKAQSDAKPKFATGGTVEQTGVAEVHAGETIIPAKGSNNFLELVAGINKMGGNEKQIKELINVNKKNARINEQNRKVSFDNFAFAKVTTDYTGFR